MGGAGVEPIESPPRHSEAPVPIPLGCTWNLVFTGSRNIALVWASHLLRHVAAPMVLRVLRVPLFGWLRATCLRGPPFLTVQLFFFKNFMLVSLQRRQEAPICPALRLRMMKTFAERGAQGVPILLFDEQLGLPRNHLGTCGELATHQPAWLFGWIVRLQLFRK